MPGEFFRSSILADGAQAPRVDASQPHIARVYDYWLGGKGNFAADRKVGDMVLEIHPQTALSVRANRAFLARSVCYLAAAEGIRQFLDVGTGLPSANNPTRSRSGSPPRRGWSTSTTTRSCSPTRAPC